MKNPFVHPALAQRGMKLIGWSARGFDATVSDIDRVASRIVSRLEPGAIVVVHQGREWSVRCIERVIDEAQRRGYRFVIPDAGALKTKR
jgi:peptidoglycan/xylan/chitin deacetylase (PgdA/CDA1 family)